jgi:hypothetical protein
VSKRKNSKLGGWIDISRISSFLILLATFLGAAAGGKVRILGFARRIGDIHTVVRTMRECGFKVIGPFRRRNGEFIYSLADCVVTERELMDLAKSGKVDATAVSELSAKN